MDKSKVSYSDIELRIMAMQFAAAAESQLKEDGDPGAIVETARGVYLFLSGRDTALDVLMEEMTPKLVDLAAWNNPGPPHA